MLKYAVSLVMEELLHLLNLGDFAGQPIQDY